MKIRKGFVSNSSSSSFCILGDYFENDSLIQILKIQFNKDDDEQEVIESKLEELGFDVWYNGYGAYYVGIQAEHLDQNKTILQIRQEIADKFNKAGFRLNLEDIQFFTETVEY